MSEPPPQAAQPVRLVVDAANVLGSRPDGWWRDRAGATSTLLTRIARLAGRCLTAPDGGTWLLTRITVVLEGRAAGVPVPPPMTVVRASGSGDDALVEHLTAPPVGNGDDDAADESTVVVTADRGLRARLPAGTRVVGPGWLRDHLDADDRIGR